jgi:hypothetical protein
MAAWVFDLGPWPVCAHHTFRWESSLDSTRRIYERFMRKALPGVGYFYAIEENPSRDGHHVHALWDSLDAPRKATHREWLKRIPTLPFRTSAPKRHRPSHQPEYSKVGHWWTKANNSGFVMPNCYAIRLVCRFYEGSDPNGIRTRVTAVKGRCPGPLDDRVTQSRAISELPLLHARANRRTCSGFSFEMAHGAVAIEWD